MICAKNKTVDTHTKPSSKNTSPFILNLTPSIPHSQSYTLHSSLCILQLSALQQRSEFDIEETLIVKLFFLRLLTSNKKLIFLRSWYINYTICLTFRSLIIRNKNSMLNSFTLIIFHNAYQLRISCCTIQIKIWKYCCDHSEHVTNLLIDSHVTLEFNILVQGPVKDFLKKKKIKESFPS